MNRWGNFLQGIESGLDRILAEDGPENSANPNQAKNVKPQTPTNVSRQNSGRQRNDRLKERLAKAVDGSVTDNSSQKFRTSNSKITQPISDKSPVLEAASHDEESTDAQKKQPERSPTGNITTDSLHSEAQLSSQTSGNISEQERDGRKDSADSSHKDEDQEVASALSEVYLLERIEALQAKLDVFVKEAAQNAQQMKADSTNPATIRIAEKDEKIAALLAEGQALSQRELKHLSVIRRMHARINEADVVINREKKAASDAQRLVQSLQIRIETVESTKVLPIPGHNSVQDLQTEVESLRKQNEGQFSELNVLRNEIQEARSNDLNVACERLQKELDAERRTTSTLRDDAENFKIERELEVGRFRTQLDEEKNRVHQDHERHTSKEAELQGEIRLLETRLETLRSKTEESATGPSDGQAKQLRQIEALQRQYSVSKDNWNGIEASLNSRVSSLERERDELVRKENDLRRKLRETMTSLRKKEEELEDRLHSFQITEQSIRNDRASLKETKVTLSLLQAENQKLKEELKSAKIALLNKVDVHDPVSQPASPQIRSPRDRSASPFASRHVLPTPDFRDRKWNGNAQSMIITPSAGSERPGSARKISLVSPVFSITPSSRQQSVATATRSSSRSAALDARSVSIDDDIDRLEEADSPATISASTPAAGPSLQLVERMSAAVRRLESEKVATKDELERMASERDEARQQIMALLEEADKKKQLDVKVADLEQQVTETTKRYQTTLELLGEKSEAVEELKADIADMKHIYREALEKSII